ncbi:MAG: hypothetical protein AAFN16_17000 [Pseudomonadota bacterium]
MATGLAAIKSRDEALFESVAMQLARAEHFGEFSFISTPLLLPNGATVVVRVSRSVEGFLVTDHGLGADEASLIDGSYFYTRIAAKVAQAANIGFDQQSFFVLQVSEAQLPGAVTVVANCVHEAVTKTFQKVEERRAKRDADRVYEKLTGVFDAKTIARDVHIIGSSNHEWSFDSGVTLDDGRMVLFEAVSKHHSSVYPAVAKFYDVARNDNAPQRVAVIGQRKAYGDYISLLSQAARVVELSSAPSVFRKAAA